jgi:Flp pilus assembly pilin Flp
MMNLSALVRKKTLKDDERGQGMAEYIIIVILVAIIVLVAIKLFGKSVFNQFGNATEAVDTLQSDDDE